MRGQGGTPVVAPFPADYRASGLLLHVTSLPSRFGIGDLGPAAFAWIDRLADSGQSWWQSLPLGPTGYANSPYQALSSFAGNWLIISPEELIADGLVSVADCQRNSFPAEFVDYEAVMAFKHCLLETAWRNFKLGARADLHSDYEQFCISEAHWLDDYALFRALKDRYNGAYYLDWPVELVQRAPNAMGRARRELAAEIDAICFAQFLLLRQGERVRRCANTKGVRLVGDLPFFVSPDSSDVWAHPDLFLLDNQQRPKFVAGVPPDFFSATGQLWGNPVYNWDLIQQTGYRWYLDRVRALLAHVDVIRLDHFRGFAAAWHVPAGAPTAQSGNWVPGPGVDLFEVMKRELGDLPFIAEDLGVITPDVTALRDMFEIPGTRVLQFAFDGNSANPHLPQNYVHNAVAYTATHDNNTTRGWFESLPEDQRQTIWRYLGRSSGASHDVPVALIELAWSSQAGLTVAPLQDLLNLGGEARMNVPGRAEGNWRWRCTEAMLAPSSFQWLRRTTESAGRMQPVTALA
ncbi:MAG: 4-alpha-glucanotransferase [Acidobacteriaceae bacterium]|nr:4-alpha-glucanotransferase [Acidobacteriaceae bacterium]MBV8572003.1 4-alpha-glucanotransferase [Acidobacteriaceae bacterium]